MKGRKSYTIPMTVFKKFVLPSSPKRFKISLSAYARSTKLIHMGAMKSNTKIYERADLKRERIYATG